MNASMTRPGVPATHLTDPLANELRCNREVVAILEERLSKAAGYDVSRLEREVMRAKEDVATVEAKILAREKAQ